MMNHPARAEPQNLIESEDIEIVSLGPADEEPDVLERRRKTQRKRHWTMLMISLATIVLSFALQTGNGGRVAFVGFSRFPLPELCGSRLMFDVECPGCGLTRSFLALAAGDWRQSLRFHRVGWILAFAVLLQIPYRLYRLRNPAALETARWPMWCGHLLIALLIINWLAKLGLK